MADLINQLQQDLQKQTVTPTQLGTPQALQSLQAQVQTGKAGSFKGPEAQLSSQQQQQTELQTQTAAQQIQQQGELMATELGQQQQAMETQMSQQEIELEERRINQTQMFNQNLNRMLTEYQQNFRQLSEKQNQAKLEQITTLMRLTNDKYLHELTLQGNRARLENEFAFKENLQRAVFQDELELFESSLDFRRAMSADDRLFEREMADMDIDFAMQIALQEARAASTASMIQGVGSLATATAEGYDKYKKDLENKNKENNIQRRAESTTTGLTTNPDVITLK